MDKLGPPYGVKTLEGNWQEDRLMPPDSLACLANFRPSYATPDDGFRESATTAKTTFANPRSRKEVVFDPPAKPVTLNTTTIPEVCHEARRPIPGTKRGFGAVLSYHEEGHGRRFWNTSFRDTFGEKPGQRRQFPDKSAMPAAGLSGPELVYRQSAQGPAPSQLVGETYREGADPASNTFVQRGWLPGGDAALANIELGGKRPVPPTYDNCLSVNLGNNYQKIRDKLEKGKGRLFRSASDITLGRERPYPSHYGIQIFQDG